MTGEVGCGAIGWSNWVEQAGVALELKRVHILVGATWC